MLQAPRQAKCYAAALGVRAIGAGNQDNARAHEEALLGWAAGFLLRLGLRTSGLLACAQALDGSAIAQAFGSVSLTMPMR